MAIEFTCDVPGFEENRVLIDERGWSRAYYNTLVEAQEEASYLAQLRAKIESCHLIMADGSIITEPNQIDSAILDKAEAQLIGFLGGLAVNSWVRLQSMGNAGVRLFSGTSDNRTTTKTKTTTMRKMPTTTEISIPAESITMTA